MSLKKQIDILNKWIKIAIKKNLTKRIKEFWLLYDVLLGDVWSKQFYYRHKSEVIEILDSLDQSKEEVNIIIEEFKRLGYYEKIVEMELF